MHSSPEGSLSALQGSVTCSAKCTLWDPPPQDRDQQQVPGPGQVTGGPFPPSELVATRRALLSVLAPPGCRGRAQKKQGTAFTGEQSWEATTPLSGDSWGTRLGYGGGEVRGVCLGNFPGFFRPFDIRIFSSGPRGWAGVPSCLCWPPLPPSALRALTGLLTTLSYILGSRGRETPGHLPTGKLSTVLRP